MVNIPLTVTLNARLTEEVSKKEHGGSASDSHGYTNNIISRSNLCITIYCVRLPIKTDLRSKNSVYDIQFG